MAKVCIDTLRELDALPDGFYRLTAKPEYLELPAFWDVEVYYNSKEYSRWVRSALDGIPLDYLYHPFWLRFEWEQL